MAGELAQSAGTAPRPRCPNCGEPVTGEYCSACGQRQRSYRQALHRVLFEFLGELFEVDGRVLKSLRLLLLRPGVLTVEFFADRRASYLTPIRLYLASSLVFFFLLSTTTGFELSFEEDSEQLLSELDPADRQTLEEALEQPRAGSPSPAATPEDSTESVSDLNKSSLEQALGQWVAAFRADPSGTSQSLIDNLPLAAFVLLPLFALLLKAFYPARFVVAPGSMQFAHGVFPLPSPAHPFTRRISTP
ncbi:MAG: DUF3667 domain-containing protein [Pseudomonadota bacterium]